MSTRWPLKQVQKNGETLKIRALHSPRNFWGISVITSGVQSGSSQHTADSAEKSCRCPLLFSTTPIHDPSLARKKERETDSIGTVSVRDNADNKRPVNVSIEAVEGENNPVGYALTFKPYSSPLRASGVKDPKSESYLGYAQCFLNDPSRPDKTDIQTP